MCYSSAWPVVGPVPSVGMCTMRCTSPRELRVFVTLSQSGETADTLEALRMAKELGYIGTLTICNSAHSSYNFV